MQDSKTHIKLMEQKLMAKNSEVTYDMKFKLLHEAPVSAVINVITRFSDDHSSRYRTT